MFCLFHFCSSESDVLYKDYAQQPPTYFNYQCFKWNFDLSCESNLSPSSLRFSIMMSFILTFHALSRAFITVF